MQGILIFVIIATGFAVTPAFGQAQEAIWINTSDKLYEGGEAVIVSGGTSVVILDTPVILQVFFGTNLVEGAQIPIAQDGSYSYAFNTEGPRWDATGQYIVRASYGVIGTVETAFDFVIDTEESFTFAVDAGSSGTFDVDYTIIGGIVSNMEIDPDDFTLAVTLNTRDDGSISLDLPRDYIDARADGCGGGDEEFIVLVDGIQIDGSTSSGSDKRTVTIPFIDGESDIRIIGTCIIPEFGTVAVMVLAVTTISVIILSRSRLQI